MESKMSGITGNSVTCVAVRQQHACNTPFVYLLIFLSDDWLSHSLSVQVVRQYELAQAAGGSARRPHSAAHTQGKSNLEGSSFYFLLLREQWLMPLA